MQKPNPIEPGTDVFCVFVVDPDSGLPQSSHTNTDVSLGGVPGVIPFSFSGVKLAISDVTQQIVEFTPTVLAPAAGIAMSIVSTDAADVGVQIRVTALGPNGAFLAPFIVTLNGLTPVPIGTLSRINSLYRIAGDVAGSITVFNGANVYAFMEPGAQIMRSATYTIPAGYKAVIQTIIGAMLKAGGNDAGVTFSLQFKPLASSAFGPIISLAAYRAGNSQIQAFQDYGGATVGPFDIQITGIGTSPGCDAQVYVSGMLINSAVHP